MRAYVRRSRDGQAGCAGKQVAQRCSGSQGRGQQQRRRRGRGRKAGRNGTVKPQWQGRDSPRYPEG